MAGNLPIKPDTSCSSCRVRELCLSMGLKPADAARLSKIIPQRLKLKKTQHYFIRESPSVHCMPYAMDASKPRSVLAGLPPWAHLLWVVPRISGN
jgi:hypothetical protein